MVLMLAQEFGTPMSLQCLDILGRCEGDKRLTMATFTIPDLSQPIRSAILQIIFNATTSMLSIAVKARLRGIKTGFVWGSVVRSPVAAVYRDFLPEALAKISFRAMPEPHVIENGLEKV